MYYTKFIPTHINTHVHNIVKILAVLEQVKMSHYIIHVKTVLQTFLSM